MTKNLKLSFKSIIVLLLLMLMSVQLASSVSGQTTTPDVMISEIRIDQPSTDNDEYFELAGVAGTSLDGLTYLVIGDGTGGSGVIEAVVDLSGNAIPSSGYFVAAESTFSLGTAELVTDLNFENSDNVTHLLVSGFSGANGDDLDADDNGVLDETPWAELVDLIALVEEENPPTDTEYHYGPPSVGPDGSFVPGHAYVCEDGWRIGPFDPVGGDDTPGAENACGSVVIPDVKISEIRIDQPSTDNDEYFELGGVAGTSLDGLTYLVIGDGTGGSGVIEAVVDLSGNAIPSSGYFVAAESTFTLGTADLVTDLNFENSDNVTHLLVSGFTGANGDDLDTDDDGVLDVMPWTEVFDLIALVEEENPPGGTEYHYGPPSIGPDGSFVPGHAYVCEDGWRIGPFDPVGGDDTPGAENVCGGGEPEIGACGDPATLISAVQGSGLSSPLVGTPVIIEGIVVGDFQNNGEPDNGDLNGFFVQEEDGDADGNPATSEGVFVYAPGSADDVSIGDVVRVAGTVEEQFDNTQLGSVTGFAPCSSNATLPAVTDVTLPVNTLDDFEMYEGMYVRFPQELAISEYFNFDRFGEIVLALPPAGQDRPQQPSAVFEPGSPEATDLATLNALSRITLDDGRTNQNPDPAIHPNGDVFDLTNTFRGGDIVQNATGVLNYAFSLYRIQPTVGADYIPTNPRTEIPDDVGGTLKVASFNVLNFFLTLDDGSDNCGPLQNVECRGADDATEFQRQRDKILSALAAIDADIFGLIELENTTGVKPLQDLVNGLNDRLGAGTYTFIDTGTTGSDAIKVGIIYKSGSVTPIGDFDVLDDPAFTNPFDALQSRSRPAVIQTFEENANGNKFTVVVNHLKSKSGSELDDFDDTGQPVGVCVDSDPGNDIPDCDQGDGQGYFNPTREAAAQFLVDYLATDPTNSGDPDFLIIGDLNAYDKEDPIDAVLAGADDALGTGDDYTDLVALFQGEFAYSYVFSGQFGYLDHGLANASLLPQITGVTEWHINSDEPDILDYDTSFKQDAQDALYEPNAFRASDHDPVIIGLDMVPRCEDKRATIYVADDGVVYGGPRDGKRYRGLILGTQGDDVIVGTDGRDMILGLKGNDVICGLDGWDMISGHQGNDVLLGGAGNDKLKGDQDDDILDGGDGRDLCHGGSGTDSAVACEFTIRIP